MPVTISIAAGDGINQAAIRMNMQIPDTAAGGVVVVQGVYVPSAITSSGSPCNQQTPITFSGSQTQTYTSLQYWLLELGIVQGGGGASAAGTLTNKFGASLPTSDAGTATLFSQLMPSGSPVMSLQGGYTFPALACVNPN